MKDFNIPKLETVLLSLTGKDLRTILLEELSRQDIGVEKIESVFLDDDIHYWGSVFGERLVLADGRVFEPHLTSVEYVDYKINNVVHTYTYQENRQIPYDY